MRKLLKFNLFVFSLLMFACSDPCDDISCENGGNCDDGTCICEDGYSGENCEIENRQAFLGIWTGPIVCNTEDPEDYFVEITASPNAITEVILSFDDGSSFPANVTSENTLDIPAGNFVEPIFDLSVDYVGNASLDDNNVMDFNLELDVEAFGLQRCSATLTK